MTSPWPEALSVVLQILVSFSKYEIIRFWGRKEKGEIWGSWEGDILGQCRAEMERTKKGEGCTDHLQEGSILRGQRINVPSRLSMW